MPFGKYPDRVKAFRKWASTKVDDSKLSDSVTPSGRRGFKRRKIRKKRAKKEG